MIFLNRYAALFLFRLHLVQYNILYKRAEQTLKNIPDEN